MVSLETKIKKRDKFQPGLKTCYPKAGIQSKQVLTQNKFSVLEDKAENDPCLIVVGDSLVKHQDKAFYAFLGRR